jgi:hypothetical protein
MHTQNNFEIEFQELEFKNSVKIKIKENLSFLFITTRYAIMTVLSFVSSYGRKQ